MIIVVEGPSAAGKSTWIAAHCRAVTVIGETDGGTAPDSGIDPDGAAAFWAQADAARWQAACRAEQAIDTVVCDTDPFKLHYIWCLWQTGHADLRYWRAALRASRQLFNEGRLGLADLLLVEIPDRRTLTERRRADTTRRRRNFDIHVQLADPLADWYRAVEQLDPRRVTWQLPAPGLPDTSLGLRQPRRGTDLFDRLLEQLPAK